MSSFVYNGAANKASDNIHISSFLDNPGTLSREFEVKNCSSEFNAVLAMTSN